MIGLYKCIMWILTVLLWPPAQLLAMFGKSWLRDRMRLPAEVPEGGERRIWIHAASVGEAGIAFSMAREIKRRYSDAVVIVTTVTSAGLARIRGLAASDDIHAVSAAYLAPIDNHLIARRFALKIRPTAFMLVETEIWPALIAAVRSLHIPITIVNGKLSKRSFRKYMILRNALAGTVGSLNLVCVQNRTFARRFNMIGVPRTSIEIIGNVKFDGLPSPDTFRREDVRRDLGLPFDVPVFVAGSTRPGEEEIIVESYVKILANHPKAVMVLAPRHLNRRDEVESLVRDAGLKLIRRSGGGGCHVEPGAVLILDTIGELVRTFASADAAFVGGSLIDYGGHNPLEPAALGIPVIFGQFMEQTGSKELLSDGAAVLVHDTAELTDALESIVGDENRARAMSLAGPAVVSRFKGTLARTLDLMETRDLF